MDIFEAFVVSQSDIDNTIRVAEVNGNGVPYPVRMKQRKSSSLYGKSGELPDIGEFGLVLHLNEYGNAYFWLGSFSDLVSNCCQSESGASLDQHPSGGWVRYNQDGETELVHASGTYLKIGASSALADRTRSHAKSGTTNIAETIPYVPRKIPPLLLFLRHTWASGAVPFTEDFPLDPRKKTVTDFSNVKNTELTMTADGTVSVTHAGFTLSLDAVGNVSLVVPGGKTIQLGDASGTKALVTEDFFTEMLHHTHDYTNDAGAGQISGQGTAVGAYTSKTAKLKAT